MEKMQKNKLTLCRVCGYDYKNYYPWGKNGQVPTFAICHCCGVEFGYGDDNIQSIKLTRKDWIDGGMQWDRDKDKKSVLYQPPPPDYNPAEQLKSIPSEWR